MKFHVCNTHFLHSYKLYMWIIKYNFVSTWPFFSKLIKIKEETDMCIAKIKEPYVMLQISGADNSGITLSMRSYAVKLHMVRTKKALLKCNNLIRLVTSCFTHCLPPSFSSPFLFVLLCLSFIFILSPGAAEHLVYLPLSPTLWPQRRGWPNLVSIDRELQWHGESQSMPRHPGQGSMTKGRLPWKRELGKEGERRRKSKGERQLIDGETQEICGEIV